MCEAEQSVSPCDRPLLLCNDVEKMPQSKVMKFIFSPPPALTMCFNTTPQCALAARSHSEQKQQDTLKMPITNDLFIFFSKLFVQL